MASAQVGDAVAYTVKQVIDLLEECSIDNVKCGEDVAYNVQKQIESLKSQFLHPSAPVQVESSDEIISS